jgi:hypothetical protein
VASFRIICRTVFYSFVNPFLPRASVGGRICWTLTCHSCYCESAGLLHSRTVVTTCGKVLLRFPACAGVPVAIRAAIMVKERCWKCNKMRSDVELRASDD